MKPLSLRIEGKTIIIDYSDTDEVLKLLKRYENKRKRRIKSIFNHELENIKSSYPNIERPKMRFLMSNKLIRNHNLTENDVSKLLGIDRTTVYHHLKTMDNETEIYEKIKRRKYEKSVFNQ